MKMKKSSCRKEELERLQKRYAGRGKKGKTRLLDEFCEHYGYERKQLSSFGRSFTQSQKSGWESRQWRIAGRVWREILFGA
jgi:hypothetical protein